MAMNARGIRDTARVLHVSTNTVMTGLKKRNLTSTRSTMQYDRSCIPSTWRWRAAAPRNWTDGGGLPPNSTKCGVTCAAKRTRGGCGTRLIITVGKSWRTSSADGKTRCFCSSKHYWRLLGLRSSTPTGGGPMSGISIQRPITWGRKTRRKL